MKQLNFDKIIIREKYLSISNIFLFYRTLRVAYSFCANHPFVQQVKFCWTKSFPFIWDHNVIAVFVYLSYGLDWAIEFTQKFLCRVVWNLDASVLINDLCILWAKVHQKMANRSYMISPFADHFLWSARVFAIPTRTIKVVISSYHWV